ncbi:alpha/beta hydrolase [Rhodopirellula sp. MGV]|uniref:alpha/beta hydrolase n=1 Tax=Rhodopirellula sp. MGV TaxID=2023130 RepID=UPI000B970907|nr:alpha/beta hydrolase [Rhodopirellula sp. MGV]OYP34925.1 hypothetical protein CGZ80_12905 [Rhodopirellula sp. MGV]PNY38179.1 alpha/beta hydrolase [Rhodopirellula baltica]
MTLHPQAKAFIENIAQQGRPGWHELDVEESRELYRSLAPLCGPRPNLQRIEELQTDNGIRLRLYCDASDPRPVIMFFHGGGWVLGDLATHDGVCRRLAKESGCAVVAVDYRLAPEIQYPGPIDDCYAATEYVYQNAESLSVDASRLAVVGDSAGGYLASVVAIRSRDRGGPPIAQQVLIYPAVEANFDTGSYRSFAEGHGLTKATMQWFWDQFLGETDPAKASLLNTESLYDLPPGIVITAEYDILRDEGAAYAKRLAECGVDIDHWRIEGMLHGFVHFAGVFDPGVEVIRQLAKQIERKLTEVTS